MSAFEPIVFFLISSHYERKSSANLGAGYPDFSWMKWTGEEGKRKELYGLRIERQNFSYLGIFCMIMNVAQEKPAAAVAVVDEVKKKGGWKTMLVSHLCI